MSPTDDLRLPPAPPLPPDVRARALRTVLDGLDRPAPVAPAPPRRLPWLLTVAAVLLVAVSAAVAVVVVDAREAGPAAAPSPALTPVTDASPPPTGDPRTDEALARCAAAVAGSDRAGEYPPPRSWRVTAQETPSDTEQLLTVDDLFVCQVVPDRVRLSLTRAPEQGAAAPVLVSKLTPTLLVLHSARPTRITIDPPPLRQYGGDGPVHVLRIDGYEPLERLRVTFPGGEPSPYDGPFPQPHDGLSVVDRRVPDDVAAAALLASCVAVEGPRANFPPELWVPIAYHDPGRPAPRAVLARNGDNSVGFCLDDPARGPVLGDTPGMPTPSPEPQEMIIYGDEAVAALLTVPPDVDRIDIAGRSGAAPCTIAEGLGLCTLDASTDTGVNGPSIVVTAYSAADPSGFTVFPG